jgi:hypothetical protein
MTHPSPQSSRRDAANDPEATLRLLASLAPPDGLSDRVHRRLAKAQAAPGHSSIWGLWMPVRRLQFAGAALLIGAIAVSSWTVLDNRHHKGPVIQTLTPAPGPSGFTPSTAERHPSSLTPIKVPPAPKKKPSASKTATPHVAKPAGSTGGQVSK